MVIDLVDHYKGCLLGLAAGDALGMPVEGLTADLIEACVGTVREMIDPSFDHFHCNLKKGQFTDDTEQTLILAKSIIESGCFDVENFATKLKEWGCCWLEDPSLNRGVGFTSQTAIQELLTGTSWKESGLAIPSCGSAMRAAPIGLVYHCNLDLVARYADLQSLPTHSSPSARAGAVAVAVGVALSFLGFSSSNVVEMTASFCRQVDVDFSDSLLMAKDLLDLEPKEALAAIGTSPMAQDTVPAAFYCYLKFAPKEALINAANGGGDTDSIASITGALIGAGQGTYWLPQSWLDCLEGREHIEEVAIELEQVGSVICGEI